MDSDFSLLTTQTEASILNDDRMVEFIQVEEAQLNFIHKFISTLQERILMKKEQCELLQQQKEELELESLNQDNIVSELLAKKLEMEQQVDEEQNSIGFAKSNLDFVQSLQNYQLQRASSQVECDKTQFLVLNNELAEILRENNRLSGEISEIIEEKEKVAVSTSFSPVNSLFSSSVSSLQNSEVKLDKQLQQLEGRKILLENEELQGQIVIREQEQALVKTVIFLAVSFVIAIVVMLA